MVRRSYTKQVFLFVLFWLFMAELPAVHAPENKAIDPVFHTVQAKNGDGIFSLLRRYKLDGNKCNFEKFLELNEIDRNHTLILEKDYKIPVLIYTYNGVSIRSTIGDEDMDKALRIKSYNEYLLAQRLRKTNYADSKILWVAYHEMNCAGSSVPQVKEREEIKSGKVNRYEPLFGSQYASVPIEDETLKNKVFYIVSGHGGPDPGARCTECANTLCEDEYAYDVSLRLARNLMQHSAIVYIMIQDPNDGIRNEQYLECDTDERSINKKQLPLNQKKRLKQRADDINRLYNSHKKKGISSQTVISIHVDSRSQSKQQDVFFYHLKGSKQGKNIATNLHETFKKKYGKYQKGRGYKGYVKDRNLYILRNTYPTAVFVELANIRNKYDHRRILLESNRQALANWLFEGLRDSVK